MNPTQKGVPRQGVFGWAEMEVKVVRNPFSSSLVEKNLLFRGKLTRQINLIKNPNKIHFQDPLTSSHDVSTKQKPSTQGCKIIARFLKGHKQRLQSRLDHFDQDSSQVLSNLKLKCSSVFSRRVQRSDQVKYPRALHRSDLQDNPLTRESKQTNTQSDSPLKGFSSVQISNRKQKIQARNQDTVVKTVTKKNKSAYPPVIPLISAKLSCTESPGRMRTMETEENNQKRVRQKPLIQYDPKELRHIKAESYCVTQMPTNQLVLSFRGNKPLEIASLTKIMTAYLILRICRDRGIDLANQKVEVQQYVEDITGTSAELIHGDIFTVEQLLYGLLLPSGNDAALVLADWGGAVLRHKTSKSKRKQNIARFVQQMSIYASSLGLKQTRYGNPHGLPHSQSRSTALEQCKLTALCLADPTFRKVCKTVKYKFTIKNTDNRTREIEWQNTNKLLRRQGFIGVKTGITVTAGPCLVSAYEFKGKTYVATVLRSNKVSRRFKESRRIIHWVLSKLYSGNTCFQETLQLQRLDLNDKCLDSDYSEDQKEFRYGEEGAKQLSKRKKILREEL